MQLEKFYADKLGNYAEARDGTIYASKGKVLIICPDSAPMRKIIVDDLAGYKSMDIALAELSQKSK